MNRHLLILCILLLSTKWTSGQSILDKEVILNIPVQSISAHLAAIQDQGDFTLTYSPSQYDLQSTASLKRSRQTIRKHLEDILKNYPTILELSSSNSTRVILKPLPLEDQKFIVKGLVIDKETGDPVIGVNISGLNNTILSYTDEDGYFQVGFKGEDILYFDYLGYGRSSVSVDRMGGRNQVVKVELDSDIIIPEILITGKELSTYIGGPGEKIHTRNISSYSNFLGDHNVVEEIKVLPSVQSGNEGQSGFIVRGGGVDQNLLRLDGVPLYEMGHIAGLSSIFVTDAVSEIVFYSDGFPARYGGRLSSILDISLKSGRSQKNVGSISLATTGASIYTSGPINEKLSYNLSGRLSWIDLYIDPLLRNAYAYDNSDLSYYDMTAKFTYQMSKTSSLALTLYKGADNVLLDRTTENQFDSLNQTIGELNNIGWNNDLFALNYKNLFDDKWILKAHLSGYRYEQSSRGRYTFEERTLNDSTILDNTIDILSFSSIVDLNSSVDLAYHPDDQLSIKAGVGRLSHNFIPTIRQSTVSIFDNPSEFQEGDSRIIADESYIYGELLVNAFENFDINAGVRRSTYKAREKQYRFTEPRLSLIYKPIDKHFFNASYSTMVQYAHLLVNPSVGLPSDLWVPSTENIEPEFAQHYSLGYRFIGKKTELSLSAYIKEYENLLEYSNAFDLFYSVLNQEEFIPVFNTSNKWEERVSSGIGTAKGIEISFTHAYQKGKINLSYAYSQSRRTFADIDGGQTFPYKFDREHDINISSNYKISSKWDLAVKWIYGSGNTFTLALEEFITPDGIKVLRASGRNNFRHLPFHHLDLHANRIFKFNKVSSKLSLGIYNVYNRLNPFYVYLYQPPETTDIKLRQVSLFPFIPHISYSINW